MDPNGGMPPQFGGMTPQPFNAGMGGGAGYGQYPPHPHAYQMDPILKKQCFLHNQPLRYFCDSCEELICYDCTVMGPHNTQLHRISAMEEAFRTRFDLVNRAIHASIVPKRAQLIAQIVRLDHRIDEVKTLKGVIEKDIRNEYGAIMERLRSAEGVKMAVLQHDIAEVQKDITRIDEILMAMEDIAAGGSQQPPMPMGMMMGSMSQMNPMGGGGGPDIVGFLHRYRQLNENIEYAVTKQFKVEIDVLPNDLPRELAERRVLLEHYEEQRKLLKFKDDVIWKLSQELKKKYDYYQDEFDKETRHEMNEWARLVDRYAGELKKYELVCSFCGQHLSDANINTECPENASKSFINPGLSGRSQNAGAGNSDIANQMLFFTDEEPPQEVIGAKRHFFGRPSLKGYKANPFRASTPQQLKEEVILQNPLAVSVLRRISDLDQQFKLDFEGKFQQAGGDQAGMIKKGDFVNVVFDCCQQQVQPSELLGLVNLFTAAFDDVVNYGDFLRLLQKVNSGGIEMGQQQIMGTPNSRLQQYQQYIETRDQANSNQMHAHQDLAFVNHGLDQMHIQDNNNNHMMSKLRDSIMSKLKPKEREVTERIRSALRGQPLEEVLRRFTQGGGGQ